MNDAEKFQFKLKLILNLKSAKDIQNWAIDRLDKNPADLLACLLYTSPSPRDGLLSRMPSSA